MDKVKKIQSIKDITREIVKKTITRYIAAAIVVDLIFSYIGITYLGHELRFISEFIIGLLIWIPGCLVLWRVHEGTICDRCEHSKICNKSQVACSWFQDYDSNKDEYPYLKARIDELKEKLKQAAIELDVTRETANVWEELCHEKSDYLDKVIILMRNLGDIENR